MDPGVRWTDGSTGSTFTGSTHAGSLALVHFSVPLFPQLCEAGAGAWAGEDGTEQACCVGGLKGPHEGTNVQ